LAPDDRAEPLNDCRVGHAVGFVEACPDPLPAAPVDVHPKDAVQRVHLGATAVDDRGE
jgi:hypothetical protein